ncbi:MAG: hypothetical protein COA42_04540 [Alteromonadaceae bacterium]|nr:MAG: hypothetical protein COA42_04540 [Alteromonadaceae bacterium]
MKRVVPKIFLAIFAVAIVLACTVWAFSPWLSRQLLDKPLRNYQLSLQSSSSIRYNPFLSRLSINKLQLNKQGLETLTLDRLILDVAPMQLFNQTLQLNEVTIDGLDFTVTQYQDDLEVAGLLLSELNKVTATENTAVTTPVTNDTADAITVVAPNIVFKNIRLTLQQTTSKASEAKQAPESTHYEQHKIIIHEVSLQKLSATAKQQQADVSILASINGTPLNSKAKLRFNENERKIDFDFKLDQFPLNTLQGSINTALSAEPNKNLNQLAGLLSLELAASVQQQGDDLHLNAPKITLSTESLALGSEMIQAHAKSQTIVINDLDLNLAGAQLQQLSALISHQSEGIRVESADSTQLLASWQKLVFNDLKLAVKDNYAFSLELDKVELEAFVASHKKQDESIPPLLTLSHMAISDIHADAQSVQIEKVLMDGLISHIILDNQKTISTLINTAMLTSETSSEAASDSSETPPQQTQETASTDSYQLRLNKFELTNSGPHIFIDQSHEQTFKHNATIDHFVIGPIDSSNADQVSTFSLKGRSNEYTQINLEGDAQLFSDLMNAKIKAQVKELSLPQLSPYVQDALGFEIKSGQFDLDLNLAIEQSVIDGKSKMHIRGLKMSGASESGDTASLLKAQTALPLNIALGMLKDKRGNIKLKIPLSGNIDDPSFGLQPFIALIIKRAAMRATKRYLMATLVPYSKVVSVALSAGELILKIRFEDLHYELAQSELESQHIEYADQFITLMQDKPKTQVKVCAVATESEWSTLQANLDDNADQGLDNKANRSEQLKTLANLRAQNFKKYVVTKGGIASSRILLCTPTIDKSDSGKPRLKIAI